MKYYFSSYKIGNEPEKLKKLLPDNARAAYISNAFDAATNIEARRKHEDEDTKELSDLGFAVDHIDLREYFGKSDELKQRLESYDLFWISGGNVFVLRKAMQLSGFDNFLKKMISSDITYGGYSAAVCVLSPNLKGYHIVDNPNIHPYPESRETEWEGLGIIDWWFAPHFDSNHPESDDINKEIEYYKEHKLPYKTLRDGEIIIM